MAKYCLDTNVLIDALRDPQDRAALSDFHEWALPSTYLSSIVVLELEAGARSSADAQAVDHLLVGPFERRRRLVTPSAAAWRSTGTALAKLRLATGQPAPPFHLIHDILLGFSCREHGLTLVTRDKDFRQVARLIPGLRLVAPWPRRPRGA